MSPSSSVDSVKVVKGRGQGANILKGKGGINYSETKSLIRVAEVFMGKPPKH